MIDPKNELYYVRAILKNEWETLKALQKTSKLSSFLILDKLAKPLTIWLRTHEHLYNTWNLDNQFYPSCITSLLTTDPETIVKLFDLNTYFHFPFSLKPGSKNIMPKMEHSDQPDFIAYRFSKQVGNFEDQFKLLERLVLGIVHREGIPPYQFSICTSCNSAKGEPRSIGEIEIILQFKIIY